MKQKKLWKKSSYILLEILIGITLLAMIGFPLIKNTFLLTKKEIEQIKSLEMNRISDLCFSEAYSLIYNDPSLLSSLKEEKDVTVSIPLSEKKIYLREKNESYLFPSFQVQLEKEKLDQQNVLHQKMNILLHLQEKQTIQKTFLIEKANDPLKKSNS